MKTAGPVRLVLVLLTITWTFSLPTKESTTRRPSQPQIGETIKQLTNQLMNVNSTSSDITLDTRTPPKVKQQLKKPPKKEAQALEHSHPGVAVPIEEADLVLDDSTKKFSFYKIENKPTTDRGLSTWVLLNSQTVPPSSSTTKTSRKPIVKQKPEEIKNLTAIDAEIFNKMTKPLFKKRPLPTTTRKPATTTVKVSTVSEKDYKLTKVKASVLSNAINTKNRTDSANTKKPSEVTTANPFKKGSSLDAENMLEVSTINPSGKTSPGTSNTSSELLPIEPKEDEVELMTTSTTSKKTRRPTTKRKKNKNRRRRPSIDKSDTNTTKLTNKVNQKEKPISTQIYNYLSREIMPTVGVGLVGLMVTAGLASYFLYPFGVARRSYEVDRKDKEGSYYYSDEYGPDGVAEEEIIGKVIAGMPANSNSYQSYRSPTSRDAYSNLKYKQTDQGFRKSQAQASLEPVYLTPSRKYSDEETDAYMSYRNQNPTFYSPQRNYNQEIIEHSQETGYTVEDKQFVVGNIPKEAQEVTPAVVPEHGPRKLPESTTKDTSQGLPEAVAEHIPRNFPEFFPPQSPGAKLRKRRSNDLENEIPTHEDNDYTVNERVEVVKPVEYSTSTQATVSRTPALGTNSTSGVANKPQSFINTLKNLFEIKLKMGLQLLQDTARAISRYISEVQRRFNAKMDMENREQPRKL